MKNKIFNLLISLSVFLTSCNHKQCKESVNKLNNLKIDKKENISSIQREINSKEISRLSLYIKNRCNQ
ncbi:hypothetical protein [Piscirickettsia salmonis]|uniref:hypothetical protein n=1 Tax=Piscirickettsia salmonis TaxID=1238 RepID=UPI000332D0F9|nr:hypothetical protein [Piscirickettsia salmonis]ERL60705.1 putative lipoprotein [Piscirickettsia salmonis LF-89 = ATCC VR-1361]